MKKALSAICIAFAFIIVSLAALYLLLGKYYSEGFSCSTWINGVYCTGKTVEEVNKELISKNVYPGISLKGPDDKELFMKINEIINKNLDSNKKHLEDKDDMVTILSNLLYQSIIDTVPNLVDLNF